MNASLIDIPLPGLAAAYLLIIIPFSLLLLCRVPILKRTGLALIRMTLQLLFVGFYLQVVFDLDHYGLNLLWLLVMILVADASILNGCGLRIHPFLAPLFLAVLIGTLLPVLVFTGAVLHLPNLLEAQYMIPVGGMILGNCLRADIIGLRSFYLSLHDNQKAYHHALMQGASRSEALRPFLREAMAAALLPTVATMATIGLVSLPGMMTGVILAGAPPLAAIKYQIAIMIAIFSGTSITVFLAIHLTQTRAFNTYGLLQLDLFPSSRPPAS